jgi:hypothetical protein
VQALSADVDRIASDAISSRSLRNAFAVGDFPEIAGATSRPRLLALRLMRDRRG